MRACEEKMSDLVNGGTFIEVARQSGGLKICDNPDPYKGNGYQEVREDEDFKFLREVFSVIKGSGG